MPVTARLLQRLHEAIGDEATNDLFAWWEEAATVNRAAVREVADLYFARFDARLEKGLSEVRSELDKGLSEVRSELDKGLAHARSDLHAGLAGVRAELADQRADLIKWMFLFWAGTVVPLAGLLIALTRG
jgi:hypothetical protein